MIKIICNSCKKETKQEDGFLFEASIQEVVANIAGKDLSVPKQVKKHVIHICKDCYDKKLKELIYGKSKK